MTALWDVRPGGRFAAWTRGFPLAIFQTSSGSQCAWVKRSAREADHSPSSSAEVKNEWSYTAAPSCCLHTNTDRVLQFLLLALCGRSVGRPCSRHGLSFGRHADSLLLSCRPPLDVADNRRSVNGKPIQSWVRHFKPNGNYMYQLPAAAHTLCMCGGVALAAAVCQVEVL